MEDRKYCVYMHKNKTNGKVYIGITSKNVNSRWRNGGGYENQYFGLAIRKYGWNNFEHIILDKNLNRVEATEKEIELISFYKSNQKEYGYNITNGGDNEITFTEDIKRKISIANSKGNHPKARKVICDGIIFDCLKDCSEHYNVKYSTMCGWMQGKNPCPQHFINMGLSYIGEKSNIRKKERPKTYKIILCEGKEFKGLKECAEHYGITRSILQNWLLGTTPIPKNFYEMGLRYSDQETPKNIQKDSGIICDGMIFKNITECAKHYNIKRNIMTSWLAGTTNMPKEFYDLGLKTIGKEIEIKIQDKDQKGSKSKCAKKIYCEELDITFGSSRDCCIYFKQTFNIDMNRSNVTAVARGKDKRYKGYRFVYEQSIK